MSDNMNYRLGIIPFTQETKALVILPGHASPVGSIGPISSVSSQEVRHEIYVGKNSGSYGRMQPCSCIFQRHKAWVGKVKGR